MELITEVKKLALWQMMEQDIKDSLREMTGRHGVEKMERLIAKAGLAPLLLHELYDIANEMPRSLGKNTQNVPKSGTGKEKRMKRKITFKNEEHRKFYETHLGKCRKQDVYHKALVYCLGIDEDTRACVEQIYDFQTGHVRTECLHDGWQTSGSMKIVRMAFNLYCGGAPSVYDTEDHKRQLEECRRYTVDELFNCGYAPYFWEAVKLRYPECCYPIDFEAFLERMERMQEN